jgi:tetratricopeptide (TPR) repeat protein
LSRNNLNNLAKLLQTTNRLAEAEPLYRRALAIGEANLGPDHPDVAIHLNNLAELLRATNRLAEAEPLYRRALAIGEASLGPKTTRMWRLASTTSPGCCRPPTGFPRRSRSTGGRWKS